MSRNGHFQVNLLKDEKNSNDRQIFKKDQNEHWMILKQPPMKLTLTSFLKKESDDTD